ncbi:MAG: hypothetical protein AABY32_04350 [Nanoarchaeota archaeon]
MGNPVKDLTGKRFGKLIVVDLCEKLKPGKFLWNCHCDCGKTIQRLSETLLKSAKLGANQSCGCAAEHDLTGKTFGKLTAIRKVCKKYGLGVIWEFKCSCGSLVERVGSQIKRGEGALHCGCSRNKGGNKRNDLTGEKFGKLTIVEFAGSNKKAQSLWKCKCDCGNYITIRGYYLRRGKESCGCDHPDGNLSYSWKGYGEIPKSYFTDIWRGAKIRNLEFSITIEQLWKKFLEQDRKCALTGIVLFFATSKDIREGKKFTASLDRINNSKGYTIDNVHWIHKKINQIRMDMPIEEFISWCRKVAENSYKINNKISEVSEENNIDMKEKEPDKEINYIR